MASCLKHLQNILIIHSIRLKNLHVNEPQEYNYTRFSKALCSWGEQTSWRTLVKNHFSSHCFFFHGSQWKPKRFGCQHSSKSLLLYSKEQRKSFRFATMVNNDRMFIFWIKYSFKWIYISDNFNPVWRFTLWKSSFIKRCTSHLTSQNSKHQRRPSRWAMTWD